MCYIKTVQSKASLTWLVDTVYGEPTEETFCVILGA